MPKDLVYDFGAALAARARGFLPHQLSFLHSILVVGDRKISRNAQIISDLLKTQDGPAVCHVMLGEENCKRRIDLLKQFSSLSELKKPEAFRKWKGEDAELMYNIKSIELLALLCVGSDKE